MNSIKRFFRVLAMIFVALFLLSLLLSMFPSFSGYDLLAGQLITGFWFFFRENLPAISWDAGTWGPGLGAFLLVLGFAHFFCKSFAARTSRHWSFASSLCVVLVIPVLFVISFIIPGIILQWEILRQVPWIDIR